MKANTGHNLEDLDLLCAVDTECTGLNPYTGARPFMVSFYDTYHRSVTYYWEVDPFTRKVVYDTKEIRQLGRWFNNPRRTCVFWNAIFDIEMLESIGVEVQSKCKWEDGMLAMHCVNSQEPSIGLKQVAAKYLDFSKDDLKDLKKQVVRKRKDGKKLGWALAEEVEADYWMATSECLKYCAGDVHRTLQMWLNLVEWMKEEGVEDSYQKEKELLPITLRMQRVGVRIDPAITRREIRRASLNEHHLLQKIRKIVPTINLNSPVQLCNYFFGEKSKGGLGLTPVRFTETGKPSVDTDSLVGLQAYSELADLILKYRNATHAKEGFFEKYRDLAEKPDGLDYWILHPNFNQVGPCTGRYSCSNPNLQNVPNALTTRGRDPIQARTPFGPRPGKAWVSCDYKQLEVRIFADVSKEETLLDAIRNKRDMHTECANKAWGGIENPAAFKAAFHALELDGSATSGESRDHVLEVLSKLKGRTDEEKAMNWLREYEGQIVAAEATLHKETSRAKAKMLLFLKVFGGGAASASELMGCSFETAQQFLQEYDAAFPRIKRFAKELEKEVARNGGFLYDNFGRKLRVPDDRPYVCVNYKVQGSAASFIKDRMIACEKYLAAKRAVHTDIEQVLTIHDELIFEIALLQGRRLLVKPIRELAELMQDHGGHFSVDMHVDVEYTTTSWSNKEKLDLNERSVAC